MQDILVEHARRKGALKRGGDRQRIDVPDIELAVRLAPEDMLALDSALAMLKESNERMHQVVMLRFFAGLTVQETALALEVDASTVARDWRVARAWLFGQLNADGKPGDD
jgi:RNA polymerase sigma factor (TIGR02999 family)